MGGPKGPHAIIKRGAEKRQFACRMTKARIQNYTHNIQYLLFQGNNCYRERASMLRYTYTVCLYTHSFQNVWLRLWCKILR